MFSMWLPMPGGQVVPFFELVLLCLATTIVIPDQMTVPPKMGSEILFDDICYSSRDGLASLEIVLSKCQTPMLPQQ